MSEERPALFSPAPGARGMTELHYAAYCGDPEELSRCLTAGMDPNQKDEYRGYTPLHWLTDMAAAGGPRVEMLKFLAKCEADLDSQTFDGDTALMLACRSGSYCGNDLVPVLLSLGANPRLRSPAATCLHEGIWDVGLVKHFLASGVSLDERDADGRTALDAARIRLADYADEGGRGMDEVVRLLEIASTK
jgi:ankyrin repeat protein